MHVREIIQKSDLVNTELATKYSVNIKTVSKWKSREYQKDKSSRPNTINYALSDLDKELIRVVRTLTWIELDDLVETVSNVIPRANRSNVYRALKAFDISRTPKKTKKKKPRSSNPDPAWPARAMARSGQDPRDRCA